MSALPSALPLEAHIQSRTWDVDIGLVPRFLKEKRPTGLTGNRSSVSSAALLSTSLLASSDANMSALAGKMQDYDEDTHDHSHCRHRGEPLACGL
jgi:hypothetical protein